LESTLPSIHNTNIDFLNGHGINSSPQRIGNSFRRKH
jgi:hypothetical protein